MTRLHPLIVPRAALALLWPLLALAPRAAHAEPVTLQTADGVTLSGEYWPAPSPNAPVVLAFHQAGSNHAEYAPIAPRLNQAGFSVLAIDQRSGGDQFGGRNLTVSRLGHSTSYDAALPDLEAALVYGRAKAGSRPVLVWGSSYSAALVFLLAARHPNDVQGLLAFSPGEYLKHAGVVHAAAKQVRVPVFIDQANDREETVASRSLLRATASNDKTLYLPRPDRGVHGSATLRADGNASGAEDNWAAVLAFLGKFRDPALAGGASTGGPVTHANRP